VSLDHGRWIGPWQELSYQISNLVSIFASDFELFTTGFSLKCKIMVVGKYGIFAAENKELCEIDVLFSLPKQVE